MTDTIHTGTETDPLFQPLQIKHLTLKNRIMSTSHASGMDDDGMTAERYQRYHEGYSQGQFANMETRTNVSRTNHLCLWFLRKCEQFPYRP